MTDDTSKVFDVADGTAGTGHDAVWFDGTVPGRTDAVFIAALTVPILGEPFQCSAYVQSCFHSHPRGNRFDIIERKSYSLTAERPP